MPLDLRKDQQDLIDALDLSLLLGDRRIVVQAPTGWGKTRIAAAIIDRELSLKCKTLFVVPAIALVNQTVEALQAIGIDEIGVIQAYHEMTDWNQPVQVCSVQTLMRRTLPDADFVILDEVHRWFDFYGKWMLDPKWHTVPFVGLSATPWRKGLGAYFTDLIIASTTKQAIADGILSDFAVFAPSAPNLKGVRTVAGDYHEGDLAERMAPLVADIVETWLQRGENRPTLCFAVDRSHARNLQQQFIAKGVTADYMDAFTKEDERLAIKARFHGGETKVVCNVGVLTTGVDWDVRCIVLARPTKSEILYCQMVGRGLRTADGKDHLKLLDHSDTTARLGFVTDIHHDHLNDGTSPTTNSNADKIALPKKCQQCSYLKPPKVSVCPACGFKAKVVDRTVVEAGELVHIDRVSKQVKFDLINDETFYREMLGYARNRGYSDGYAYHKTIERFGRKPPWAWKDKGALKPTAETLSYVRYMQIKYAKSRFRRDVERPAKTSSGPVAAGPPPPWD